MKQLSSGTLQKNDPPKNLHVEDRTLFERFYNLKTDATTLQVIKNADVLKDVIFDLSSFRFYDNYTSLLKPPVERKLKRLLLYLTSPKNVDKGIWITDQWSSGYFHWFCDALTRLIAAEEHLDGHYVLLPEYYSNFSYVEESLRLLNCKCLFYHEYKRVHIKELLAPSHTSLPGYFNNIIINKLRDRFRSKYNIKPTKKIYISRQKASRRKVVNENDIIIVLKTFGYEIHHFEDYDFNTQLTLMHEATHLIGLHGAGLTNMLFMPDGAKILELRIRESSDNNCFYMLAAALCHEYYYLINVADGKEVHTANITVDPDKLKSTIQQME